MVPIFEDGIVLFKGITCKIARFDVLIFLMKSFVGVFSNYLAVVQLIRTKQDFNFLSKHSSSLFDFSKIIML